MYINALLPTPKQSTSKRGSIKWKRNNSGDNKLSNINTNKPFKPENTRKALKPKPKPRATATATIVLTRKTRATITRVAPLKKRAKDAKTIAISPMAGVEVANTKPKTRRKARTDVNRNVSRMLPPRPSLDFAQYIQFSLLPYNKAIIRKLSKISPFLVSYPLPFFLFYIYYILY